MTRVISGRHHQMPEGMSPMEWAAAVWAVVDSLGVGQEEAKVIVAARAKGQRQPPMHRMVSESRNKGVTHG